MNKNIVESAFKRKSKSKKVDPKEELRFCFARNYRVKRDEDIARIALGIQEGFQAQPSNLTEEREIGETETTEAWKVLAVIPFRSLREKLKGLQGIQRHLSFLWTKTSYIR